MNCNRVEKLLPLYVGHDLEDERAMLVTAHVRTCTQCARSAQEYRETNQLMQRFEPPQFSEATYLAVRNSVLREMATRPESRHFLPRSSLGPPEDGRPAAGNLTDFLLLIVPIRLVCLKSRIAPAYGNWCLYAMGVCHCHHLRSYVAQR